MDLESAIWQGKMSREEERSREDDLPGYSRQLLAKTTTKTATRQLQQHNHHYQQQQQERRRATVATTAAALASQSKSCQCKPGETASPGDHTTTPNTTSSFKPYSQTRPGTASPETTLHRRLALSGVPKKTQGIVNRAKARAGTA